MPLGVGAVVRVVDQLNALQHLRVYDRTPQMCPLAIISDFVAGDPAEPLSEALRFIEIIQALKRAHKRLLRDVFRNVRIIRQRICIRLHHRPPKLSQNIKCFVHYTLLLYRYRGCRTFF